MRSTAGGTYIRSPRVAPNDVHGFVFFGRLVGPRSPTSHCGRSAKSRRTMTDFRVFILWERIRWSRCSARSCGISVSMRRECTSSDTYRRAELFVPYMAGQSHRCGLGMLVCR